MLTYPVPGAIVTEREHCLPLDHAVPDGARITVFTREIADPDAGEGKPYLLFLQGGPGFEASRPTSPPSGWMARAIQDYRVLLLDQRGTGRSTPVGEIPGATPAEQAAYLTHFRADGIVRDAELIREELGGERWSVLGQSFGGFTSMSYLSFAPHGLREAFITGGLAPIGRPVDDVYRATYVRLLEQDRRYFERYPQDRARVREIHRRLGDEDVRLPSGDRLTARRFQQLGLWLGAGDGFELLHHVIELPFGSRAFLEDVEHGVRFGRNPLYATLHESSYADGGATRWSADRLLPDEVRESELFTAEHGRPYATSRVRLGAIHERVGLPPSAYLAGMALELDVIIRTIFERETEPTELVDALIRATFYDLCFVLDAYMSARLQSLLDSEGYAAHLLTRMPAAVLVVDDALRVVSANQTLLRMFGVQGELIYGLPLDSAIPIMDLERHVQAYLADEEAPSTLWVESAGSQLFRVGVAQLPLEEGKQRLALIVDDVTEVRRLSLAAADTDARYRDVVSDVEGAVWEADVEGQMTLVTPGITRLTGYAPSYWREASDAWLRHLHPDEREVWQARSARALQDEKPFSMDHRLQTREGHYTWVRSSVRPTRAASDHSVHLRGLSIDIAEKVATKQALTRQLRREQALGRLAKVALDDRKLDTLLTQACLLIKEELELDGSMVFEIQAGFQPTLRAVSNVELQTGVPALSPMLLWQLDGLSLIPDLTEDEALGDLSFWSALQARSAVLTSLVEPSQHRSLVLLGFRHKPGTFPEGSRSFVTTVCDLIGLATKRAIAEEDLLRDQKLKALGTLAAGIAHDFSNILMAIQANAEVLRLGERDPSLLEQILEATEQGTELVKQVRAFARPASHGVQIVDISEMMHGSLRFLRALLPSGLRVETGAIAPGKVRANPSELQQVVLNLALNGAQAMELQGTLTLALNRVELDAPLSTATGTPLKPGCFLVLSVRDTGPGIPAALLESIFEPFFTTKSPEQGMGMGLAIVGRVLEKYAGGATIETQEECGTTVRAWLPCFEC